MDQQSIEDFIIQKYQDEERTMVQLFVEWCRSHQHEPKTIYDMAYPDQQENSILLEVIDEIQDQTPLQVSTDTLLNVLQVFGNDELAFIIAELSKKERQDRQ